MPPSSGKAQLFAERDYGGAVTTLEEGIYHLATGAAAAASDAVSSLKVAPRVHPHRLLRQQLPGRERDLHGRHRQCRRRVPATSSPR